MLHFLMVLLFWVNRDNDFQLHSTTTRIIAIATILHTFATFIIYIYLHIKGIVDV